MHVGDLERTLAEARGADHDDHRFEVEGQQCIASGEGARAPARVVAVGLCDRGDGGLGHVPTDITGFGVRLTVELLTRTTGGADDLARRLDT